MRRETFPDPIDYDSPKWVEIRGFRYRLDGVVSLGTPLTIENVREAYSKGIFPWYTPEIPLPWHSPDPRAILIFNEITIPRSLAKVRRQGKFTFTIDRDFRSVIEACSEADRPDQPGTWITREFIDVFVEADEAGFADSVEAWNVRRTRRWALRRRCRRRLLRRIDVLSRDERLKARSSLSHRPSARTRRTWLDIQVMTPHLAALGAREIPRRQFLAHLHTAQTTGLKLFE